MVSPSAELIRSGGEEIKGPVPGAAGIKTSVGQGGANKSDDVKAVQIALNSVPAALGGAGESLAVDGLVGPKTIGAISDFQLRWLRIHDKRCDPRGPTLGLLNAMAGVGDALPPGTATMHAGLGQTFVAQGEVVDPFAEGSDFSPASFTSGSNTALLDAKPKTKPKPPKPKKEPTEEEKKAIAAAEARAFVVQHHHLSIVKRWLLSAIRVVTAAAQHAARIKTLGELVVHDHPDRLAFLLVAKSFKLHERNPAEAVAGCQQVELIFRRSLTAVVQHLPRIPGVAPSPLVNTPLFVSLFGIPKRIAQNALAYAPRGGLHLKPGSSNAFNAFVKPGQVVPEFDDRMYLTPLFDALKPNLQRLTLIHELAHWVGSRNGAGAIPERGTIDDHSKWVAMSSFERLHTADSYGFFATECNVGSLTAIVDGDSDTNTIPLFPRVEASFIQTTPTISLPPKGDVLEPKFKFPAGALF